MSYSFAGFPLLAAYEIDDSEASISALESSYMYNNQLYVRGGLDGIVLGGLVQIEEDILIPVEPVSEIKSMKLGGSAYFKDSKGTNLTP